MTQGCLDILYREGLPHTNIGEMTQVLYNLSLLCSTSGYTVSESCLPDNIQLPGSVPGQLYLVYSMHNKVF